jgi:rubrerythrin
MSGVWDFDEARDALRRCSSAQQEAEKFIKDAYQEYAQAERAYRFALAQKITDLRAQSQPVTLAADLARGDKHVADLRFKRDVREGVVEAAKQRAYTAAADRKDAQGLATWSQRRELAEIGIGTGG